MLLTDKGIRDLLPLIEAYLANGVPLEDKFDGALVTENEPPAPAVASAALPLADPPPHNQDDADGRTPLPIKPAPHSSAAFQVPTLENVDAEHDQTQAPAAPGIALLDPLAASVDRGAGGHSARKAAQDEPGRDGHESVGEDDDPSISHNQTSPVTNVGDAAEYDHTHTISVSQDAEVNQDANVIVHGYAGKVVIRLHIDQDLLMDQDVDIDFDIDGDGRFFVTVDQDMRIDQYIDIDLKIFDVDGVLYVDFFLKDKISVEQDTTLDMYLSDGSRGGSVSIDQNLEMDQDVDIDIDIEDDLEERYIVKVDIDVLQDVEADQDVAVDITDRNGEIDMDVDAYQTAYVDQETTARIDFAMV